MQTTNQPQTTNNTDDRDASVQISAKRRFSIVENAGTDHERTVREGLLSVEIDRYLKRCYTQDELDEGFAQAMLELPDGSLTTDF